MKKYNYGCWCNNDKIKENWSLTDYWLNNQQLKKSKLSVWTLSPQTSSFHINLKYCLYGMIDLYKNGLISGCNIKTLYDIVIENKKQYDLWIIMRLNKTYERQFEYNYLMLSASNLPKDYDMEKKLNETFEHNNKKMQLNAKANIGSLRNAILFLLGTFVEIKEISKHSSKNYNPNKVFPKKLYYFNSNGKSLMAKVVNENYLL